MKLCAIWAESLIEALLYPLFRVMSNRKRKHVACILKGAFYVEKVGYVVLMTEDSLKNMLALMMTNDSYPLGNISQLDGVVEHQETTKFS